MLTPTQAGNAASVAMGLATAGWGRSLTIKQVILALFIFVTGAVCLDLVPDGFNGPRITERNPGREARRIMGPYASPEQLQAMLAYLQQYSSYEMEALVRYVLRSRGFN